MSNAAKNSFILPFNREQVTREPDTQGRWSHQYPEMLGFKNQGGGKVPEDFTWASNPKQWQEELTEQQLRREQEGLAPALPPGVPSASAS